MKWETYKLKQLVRTQNHIGQWSDDYEDIATIDVMISNNLYTQIVGDAVVRAYAPSAVSKFKAFEKDASYKITNQDHEYLVESFNASGRYSSLLLKEVVFNG